MNMRSIRFRLTVWYSLALGAGLVFFGLVTWVSMRQSLLYDARDLLITQIGSAQSFVDAELVDPKVVLLEELSEYAHALPVGNILQIRGGAKQIIFSSVEGFPWRGGPESTLTTRPVFWQGKTYLFGTETKTIHSSPWQFAFFVSLDETNRLLNKLRLFLITLLPAVMIAAAWGGSWLSRRALKPVDDLTAAARSVSLESLSRRLFVPQTGDEIQRLAETLNALLSRLDAALQRLSQFTANAAHELRTPVAVIRTTAELAARRDRPAESYRQALVQVTSEAEGMTKLLDDLLLLARTDSAAVEMPKQAFDLASTVKEACGQMNPLALTRQIQLEYLPGVKSTLVMGNEAAIRQLAVVLLDNAIKYSPRGGEVRVSIKDNEERIHLEVADSGPGIREEDRPHIFERFYRSPKIQYANPSGSGLGLALAASIAKMHATEIEVAGSPMGGTVFSIDLGKPAAPVAAGQGWDSS
jgi:heavy metal sensor kinase